MKSVGDYTRPCQCKRTVYFDTDFGNDKRNDTSAGIPLLATGLHLIYKSANALTKKKTSEQNLINDKESRCCVQGAVMAIE